MRSIYPVCIEPMEPRTLLAGMWLLDGRLEVHGTGKNDLISIYLSRSDDSGERMLSVKLRSQITRFELADVDWIYVDGASGNDRIFLDQLPGDLKLKTSLFGSLGDDTIHGGAGSDRISGHRGDDSIRGGGGRDFIYGDDGQDTLNGENGNDYLNGGEGGDVVLGGRGDDRCIVGPGSDSIDGGDGADSITAGAAEDALAGLITEDLKA